MRNTKLPDFPKATSALVNNGNADRARAILLFAYKHAAKIHKKRLRHPNCTNI
jgi:ribosomal protein S20